MFFASCSTPSYSMPASAAFGNKRSAATKTSKSAQKSWVTAAAAGRSLKREGEFAEIEKKGEDVFNKTYQPKSEDCENSRKPWVVVNAEGLKLGRMASVCATYLRGGNVATYHPAFATGVNLVVVNAEKVVVSGKKFEDKLYRNFSTTGRPGSMKIETFKHLQKRLPERIVEKAIRGMLPKNRMGREVFRHLNVYKGSEHPHAAQSPVDVTKDVLAKCGGESCLVSTEERK